MALKSHSMAYSDELNNKLIIIRSGIWAGAGATQRKKVIITPVLILHLLLITLADEHKHARSTAFFQLFS